jgi:hypothetical protein
MKQPDIFVLTLRKDPTVYMTKTLESESAEQTPIPFGDRSTRDLWSRGSPIWCCPLITPA